jgi:aldose sugar dehydrogenase
MLAVLSASVLFVALVACNGAAQVNRGDAPFTITTVANFEAPWAMAFLPDGALLVTEMAGALKILLPDGAIRDIGGVPEVDHGGQGGLGDVLLHPAFEDSDMLYLSYAEPGDGNTRGAAVARARLVRDDDGGGTLADVEVIWRQEPKVSGQGHYAHRLLFGPEGHLWISSGDRQQLQPAQDLATNLGKILRLDADGTVPQDNPFADQGGVAAQIWTLGHRNPLGMAFDAEGRLWSHEMGPRGGDELNLIERGQNYGWPEVSAGRHYDGTPIPEHATRPEFRAPVIEWTPVISPAGFIIYTGDAFPRWAGSGLIGGLSGQVLVRVALDGETAHEAERFAMGMRIREVAQGHDGAVWLLEDGRRGGGGRLLRLDPSR